jgi:hypothetical protein
MGPIRRRLAIAAAVVGAACVPKSLPGREPAVVARAAPEAEAQPRPASTLASLPMPSSPMREVLARSPRGTFGIGWDGALLRVVDDRIAATLDGTWDGYAVEPSGSIAAWRVGEVALVDADELRVTSRMPLAAPSRVAVAPGGKTMAVAFVSGPDRGGEPDSVAVFDLPSLAIRGVHPGWFAEFTGEGTLCVNGARGFAPVPHRDTSGESWGCFQTTSGVTALAFPSRPGRKLVPPAAVHAESGRHAALEELAGEAPSVSDCPSPLPPRETHVVVAEEDGRLVRRLDLKGHRRDEVRRLELADGGRVFLVCLLGGGRFDLASGRREGPCPP